MPKNPITDIWQFLTGTTSDHLSLGVLGKILAILYFALLVGSIVIAIVSWREDASQRSGMHFGTWLVRLLIGTMWFEGMLWKLPLPVSDGLKYWTEQMGTRAAFDVHRDLVNQVLLPKLGLFGPLVFLAEFSMAIAFILGFGVRLAGIVGILFVTNLWLGIYRPGEPAEWPWAYMFLMLLMLLLVMHAAGRSLGLDGWLRRNASVVREGIGAVGGFLRRIG